jgi:hypothetical protein
MKMENHFNKWDVLFSMKPMIQILRIFGLLPLSFFKSNIFEGEIRLIIADVIYVLVWIVVLLVGLGLGVYLEVAYPAYPLKMSVCFILETLSSYFTSIVTLIISMSLNRRNIPLLLRKLSAVDRMIKPRQRNSIYSRTRTIVTALLVTVCPLLVVELFWYSYMEFGGTLLDCFCGSVYALCTSCNILTLVQYCSLVLTLQLRYKYVNDILKEYFEVREEPTRFYTINVTNVVERNEANYAQSASNSNINYISCKCNEIRTLRLIYLELYDAVNLVSSHFGVPVLFATIFILTYCVSTVYFALYELRGASEVDVGFHSYFDGAFHILISLFWLIALYLLVACCSRGTEESNTAVITIQRILLHPGIKQEIVCELEKLCSQARLMKVEFTACGFFNLNLPFLGTTISGVCTYILIMLQLQ